MTGKNFLVNSHLKHYGYEHSLIKPFKTSLLISIVYIILISIYIIVSGEIAAEISKSVISLKNIELYKGILFAIVSGGLLFGFSFILFNLIKRKHDQIISQNDKIISLERLVTTGIFALSVSHDINNYLTIISGNLEILNGSKHMDENEIELLCDIKKASGNIKRIIQRMMISGKDYIPGKKIFTDIVKVINETVEFVKIHDKMQECHFRLELPEKLVLNINDILFARSLVNLLLNAAEAQESNCEIVVKVIEDSEYVYIEVHDNGPGIIDENLDLIQEPFYTTKKDGNGLGLLSLKIFAMEHKGKVDIRKSELGGACFSVSILK